MFKKSKIGLISSQTVFEDSMGQTFEFDNRYSENRYCNLVAGVLPSSGLSLALARFCDVAIDKIL